MPGRTCRLPCPRRSRRAYHRPSAGQSGPMPKDDRLGQLTAAFDNVVGERAPAQFGVRVRGMLAHGERSVEEQDALLCQGVRVSRGGNGAAQIGFEFLIDVAQARRQLGLRRWDRERQSHGLVGSVIRVLTQDDNLDLVGRRVGEGIEDVVLCRVDGLLGTQKGDALEQPVRSFTYRPRRIAQPSCYVAVAGCGVHGAPLWQMLC